MEPQRVVDLLQNFVLPERLARMQQVLAQRVGNVALLLENIYQGHNASAILRSADAFGFQHIFTIEDRNRFAPNSGVSLGAEKWLSRRRFDTADAAVAWLKKHNWRIVATSTHCKNAIPLTEYQLTPQTVFAFGTELTGLSETVLEAADACVYIPMHGFVESFNVSVSAALTMYELRRKIEPHFEQYALSKSQQLALLAKWLIASVRGGEKIIEEAQ